MNASSTLWAGRVLTGLYALFMLGASVAPKLLQLPIAEQAMAQLGWPAGYAFMIGLVELACVVLYLIPRTSVLGAVLTMGLLGGAMATRSERAARSSAISCSASISGCSRGAGCGCATRASGRCFPSRRKRHVETLHLYDSVGSRVEAREHHDATRPDAVVVD